MKNKYINQEIKVITLFSILAVFMVVTISLWSVHYINNRSMVILILLIITLFIIFIFYIRQRMKRYMQILAKNELKYKNLNERFELAIDGTNDGLWDWNIAKGSIYFSPRWKAILGFYDDELANTFDTWESRVHPDDIQNAKEKIKLSHENPNVMYSTTHRLRHKNGSWVWILDRGQTIYDENAKAVRMLGFHTDITKQKNLEKEILEKDEMMIAQSRHAAMGEMISMIAHQWRQPISVIAMAANNILVDIELKISDEKKLHSVVNSIIYQTSELSKTIDDFREFFKPNKSSETVLLKDIFDDALNILGKSLENSKVELFLNIEESIELTTFSRELMQVLINIIKNAQEVLVEKEIKSKNININCFQIKEQIIIEISDNAGGIDNTIIDKIFDPYFTTKGNKNGTGLGLYMSETIIYKHLGGSINVENTTDGACFIIKLPVDLNKGLI